MAESSNSQSYLSVVRTIAARANVDVAELHLDSNVDNTDGWDSLSFMEVIAELEETHSVRFSPSEVARMFSVRNIVGILEKKESNP